MSTQETTATMADLVLGGAERYGDSTLRTRGGPAGRRAANRRS